MIYLKQVFGVKAIKNWVSSAGMVIERPGGDERTKGCSMHVEKNWAENDSWGTSQVSGKGIR